MKAATLSLSGFQAVVLCLTMSALCACQARRIGWVEPVCVEGLRVPLMAKMDTGADRTSIDAQAIENMERDGEVWVRFRVAGREDQIMELPVLGEVRLRRQAAEAQRRPTVRLVVRLAGARVPVEASLADRSGYEMPLLIGRDVLAGRFLVDSARRGPETLACPAPS